MRQEAQFERQFATVVESQARLAEAQARTGSSDHALIESHKELAAAQKQTDERLQALIEIVRSDRNGNSG